MYAIIKTGGKQYRVKKDDIIDVEILNPKEGAEIEFRTIFVHDGENAHIGEPEVADFFVKGEIVGSSVGPKIVSMKYQPRENQRTKWGHRQHYSRIKITSISSKEEKSSPKKSTASKRKEKATPQTKENE